MIGVPEGKEREKGAERIFEEEVFETPPDLTKNINLHIWEAQQTPSRIKIKESHTRDIIGKLMKDTEKILKQQRNVTHLVQGIFSKINSWHFIRKWWSLEVSGMMYSESWKKKSVNQ